MSGQKARDEPVALIEPLTALAIAAGQVIVDIARGDLGVRAKADQSPLTAADLAADRVIAEGLARLARGMAVISEETVDQAEAPPGAFFLVDPLDGTREFVAGRDEYTVNIALIVEGRPALGIVGAPARGTLWRGGPGLGAERLDYAPSGKILRRQAIHARSHGSDAWTATVSRSHPDAATQAFLSRLGNVRQIEAGSALKLCLIAEGEADIYPRFGPTSEWDIAAGHAVVEGAGGYVETPQGGPMIFGNHDQGFKVQGFIAWGDPAAARAHRP